MVTGQAALAAEGVVTLDRLVDGAYRLDAAALVDRAGNGEALLEPDARQCGDQCEQLGARSRITLDRSIELFEDETRAQGEFQAAERLAEAAHVIGRERGALTLRTLQALAEVATEHNSTLDLLPIPFDVLDALREHGASPAVATAIAVNGNAGVTS